MKKFLATFAAAAAFTGSAQAATLLNGSFESGTNPGTFTTVAAGDTAITGWTVAGGSVDYIGSYWTAQNGVRSIDLSGNSIGTLAQTINDLIAGVTYNVTYWVSKNPDGGAPTRTGTIAVGNSSSTFSYSAVNDRTNMLWESRTFSFLAGGTSGTLSFASDSSGDCCFGPALDNVSIAAVPEPATWAMMITGFGLVGGAMRRRNAGKLAFA